MKLDRFYPIFDDSSWLERLLPLGVKLVQIRVKDKSINDVREQLIHSRELCETYNSTLIINDYWELAIELGCDWVHLGQEDLDEADIGALKKRGVKLGLSTHDQDELDRALTFEPDYIATDHWHAFNTLYFIMDGEMQFGEDEPIYKKGDIRVVKAGYSYGPEKPGKDGVKFILISNGGPVDLNWSDINPPPQ